MFAWSDLLIREPTQRQQVQLLQTAENQDLSAVLRVARQGGPLALGTKSVPALVAPSSAARARRAASVLAADTVGVLPC